MNEAQTRQVLAVLLSYYPGRKIETANAAAWGEALAAVDFRDGVVAAKRIGPARKYLPSLAELLDEVRTARIERWQADPEPALPGRTAGTEFVGIRSPSDDLLSEDEWREDEARRASRGR